jgi:hypothetical protein
MNEVAGLGVDIFGADLLVEVVGEVAIELGELVKAFVGFDSAGDDLFGVGVEMGKLVIGGEFGGVLGFHGVYPFCGWD